MVSWITDWEWDTIFYLDEWLQYRLNRRLHISCWLLLCLGIIPSRNEQKDKFQIQKYFSHSICHKLFWSKYWSKLRKNVNHRKYQNEEGGNTLSRFFLSWKCTEGKKKLKNINNLHCLPGKHSVLETWNFTHWPRVKLIGNQE